MLKSLSRDPVLRRQFAMYLAIGGTVFFVDLCVFQVCVGRRMYLPLASTIAYFTGTTTHFLLNRYANFRRFDRAIHDQARTFAVLIFVQWLLTLAIITFLVGHGLAPIVARISATAINLPFGFLANRYLTFGVGIVPRLLKMRRRD